MTTIHHAEWKLNWSIKLSGTLMNIHIVFSVPSYCMFYGEFISIYCLWRDRRQSPGVEAEAVKCPYFSTNTAGAMFKVNLPCLLLIWPKYFAFNFIKYFTRYLILFHLSNLNLAANGVWPWTCRVYGHWLWVESFILYFSVISAIRECF